MSVQVSCPQGACSPGQVDSTGSREALRLFPKQVMELVLFMKFVGRLQGPKTEEQFGQKTEVS